MSKRRSNWNRADIYELYERDGGICWLCKDYVDLELGEATRDHLLTYAVGIEFTSIRYVNRLDNLRLAHAECNYLRSEPADSQIARDMLLGRADLVNRKPI